MTGLFITFEGGDGAGKSTQLELLASAVSAGGREVVTTREPGGTDLGAEIRSLVLHRRGHVAPRAEALLYAADRAQHVATLVRPALDRGAVVLQDRYLDSSIAYQGAGRVLGAKEVRDLSLWASESLLPELTVLLDLDPVLARQRIHRAERGVYDRLEAEQLAFHESVREAFLRLAQDEPSRWLVIDASAPADVIHASILERVTPLLSGN